MAKRRTNQEWQSILERYENRDITQRAFCETNGLYLSTFHAKRQQLNCKHQDGAIGFVRTEIVEKTTTYQADQIATANMTLLVNEVELSTPQGTPATYLAELIGALS
ncbi:IS66 family insertion sequence element accessory protein TnpB [Vibrio aestuarianus]|uniref:IS66 family insertion sequence element accessory protein TnpA n=1 Tax=Vibrio aestuarianus TaxID=28171 RepID=UPI001558894B|nr:IS66 family insertion sequence element accessory protein TnpB [Vibrio aestuarianus]NGZ15278.1 IS66 family insertion sequence element accessory protein TnpB [Vibrio aestuarianus]NKZ51426.1 IS66 family insertion sequence element accessory protein TnpB [Vibrio aestuarianus]